MSQRKPRERIVADFEYEIDEGVRTLVNAINLLFASEADEYRFWSAFYKFAVDNNHRVMTEGEHQRLKDIEYIQMQRRSNDDLRDARKYVKSPKVQWSKE